jgi:TRAP transporter TAXI family solute receptor
MWIKHTLIAALALLLVAGPIRAAEEIVVAAGADGGKYFKLGQIICAVLNRKSESIECAVMAMPAGDAPDSFSNLVNVRNGAGDIGIARSNWQYFAVTGSGPVQFMHGNFDTIRSLFSIGTRPFTLIAKRDAGIGGLADLNGKRVNIGRPHTDIRATMDLVIAAQDWTKEDFQLAEELTASEQSLALCHGWVQAITYDVGHPDAVVGQVIKLCDAKIVAVNGPVIDKLLEETAYLAGMTIPGGLYEGASEPVPTFGTTITVVSTVDVPEDVVYEVVAAVFDNLETLKALYPALRHLDPAQMLKDGLSAPLHDGAKRYFSDRGWM